MAVIAHLRIPAESFELGRILEMDTGTAIELENLVPLGEKAIPFFTVTKEARDSFEEDVGAHPSVDRIEMVTHHDDETLYALEWNADRDVFIEGIRKLGGQVLSAAGSANLWEFEIRFPTHEDLSAFQDYCISAIINLEIGRLFNPSKPGNGMWFGLTLEQREALVAAVRGGYYSIPRDVSTKDLAADFGISDQAVTERLRRGITTLVENTILALEDDRSEEFVPVN